MDSEGSSKRKRVPSTTAKAPQAEATGRARKRAKTQDARNIAVQSSDTALKDGQLDVDKFVKAREYEIRALEAGLSKSKKALTTRAFQSVPKDLRRRTASHNVKRVPKRLRNRAEKEMVEDNTPTVTARRRKPTSRMRLRLETAKRLQQLSARAKTKVKHSKTTEQDPEKMVSIQSRQPKPKQNSLDTPPRPPSKFRKRQLHKTWLPTHLFHAKRAHMTTPKDPLWRFALPLTPTEKSYRPTHRVSTERGAIAWDVSYMSTIGLEGLPGCIEGALRALGVDDVDGAGDPWGKRGRKWRAGKRSWEAWVFEKTECPSKPIAPVSIIWCADVSKDEDPKTHSRDASEQRKGKVKARRKLLFRVHPSAFLQIWEELLKVSKIQSPPVMVEDLRFEIGSIEVTGPGSTEALGGILKPKMINGAETSFADGPEHTWTSLASLPNPACLPPNAILGFCISDPRLHHPSRTLAHSKTHISQEGLQRLLATWPPDQTQSAPLIFERTSRHMASRALPSQKATNRRKGLALPGEYPEPLPTDPEIPILLLASRPASSAAQGTWTLMLPWKCVLPVWYPLMHYPLSTGGQVRFGGLREKRQISFEAGMPWFPADYPGTKAGWDWELMERARRHKEWSSRPKSKRIEWESVDLGGGRKGEVGLGWACDWEKLLVKPAAGAESVEQTSAPSQTATADETPTTSPPSGIYHLVSTPPSQLPTSQPPKLPPQIPIEDSIVLMTVKVTVITRGTPTACARIYSLENIDPELRRKWLSLIPTNGNKRQAKTKTSYTQPAKDAPVHIHRQHLASSLLTPTETGALNHGIDHIPQAGDPDYPIVPGEEALIGFVTSGNFNLKEGKGVGIGCLDVTKVKKWNGKEARFCVIREAGLGLGRLARWEVV
ncbi:MAG: hypothetical protein M1812_002398 [Candelaria pacifica]|nr:MAG: hypothetical protein M1812_002398 [Candelaria pacifica]